MSAAPPTLYLPGLPVSGSTSIAQAAVLIAAMAPAFLAKSSGLAKVTSAGPSPSGSSPGTTSNDTSARCMSITKE